MKNNRQRKLGIESLEHRQMLSANQLLPFSGDSVLYQIHGRSGYQGQLSEIDVASGSFANVGANSGFKINGIGYRTSDDYIYGMEMSNDHLIRLGGDGTYERLGAIDGLPPGSYYTGDFGHDGLLYVRHGNTMYGINVDDVAVERKISATGVSGIADIAYNPETELYYAVRRQSGTVKTADFISVDLREGAELGKVTVISSTLSPGGTYGAVFSDANGRVFAANNAGGLYEIDVETGEATYAGKTPAASSNDGAAPTNVAVNLPPVVEDAFVSTVQGASGVPLDIVSPSDLEGDSISIEVSGLPSLGTVMNGASPVSIGETLTDAELTSLIYDAPATYDGSTEPGVFTYTASDGEHTVTGIVEFELSGESQLVGRVQIYDESDYGAFEGYVFNNEIRLTGFDTLGSPVSETVFTDELGAFEFHGLLPGTYQLEQVQPEDIMNGFASAGELGQVASENVIHNIVIPTGSANRFTGFEFIEYAPSMLSGFVFIDENMDGEIGVQEAGVADVTLHLSGTDDLGQSVSSSTTSDYFGYYAFDDLRPGVYTITQDQPTELTTMTEIVGSEGGIRGTNVISAINLGEGVTGQQYSFGEIESSSITGAVYIDGDIDRAFDTGDVGIEGNPIRLTGEDFLGNDVDATDVTDAFGAYEFHDLLPGTYTLTQTEQPEDTNDGRENVGSFEGNANIIERNGVAGNDTISGIELRQGELSHNNNFGELLDFDLARRFDERISLQATDGDDIIDIVFGEVSHSITINGVEQVFGADQVIDFNLNALDGEDTITITGLAGVEEARLWSNRVRYHGENWRINVTNTEEVTVEGNGGYDLAYLYGTSGDENVKSTESYLRMQGDGFFNKAVGFHRAKAYSGGGTNDRAYFYDSSKDDTIKMTPQDSRMFNRKFYNIAIDFDRVYAYAVNGGTDHARMWDSSRANDRFEATDGFARMYNKQFYNAASGFEIMVGVASGGGGNDRAYMNGTAGDDVFVSTPSESGMSGDGFEIQSEKFERVYATGGTGNDQAYLYDSKLNDRFIATPENARLYNSRYFVSASRFDQVDAYSSNGGSDRAYFHDSDGDDTLIALENEVRLYGDGFNNLSHGFARAYIYGGEGGNDSAYLFDTDRADTVKVSASNTRMYGRGYYTRVSSQWQNIEASFSDISSRDRAIAFGVLDTTKVEATGGLATIMSQYGASFIYDADGLLELNNEDPDDDDGSVFADLFPDDELFEIPSAT